MFERQIYKLSLFERHNGLNYLVKRVGSTQWSECIRSANKQSVIRTESGDPDVILTLFLRTQNKMHLKTLIQKNHLISLGTQLIQVLVHRCNSC